MPVWCLGSVVPIALHAFNMFNPASVPQGKAFPLGLIPRHA